MNNMIRNVLGFTVVVVGASACTSLIGGFDFDGTTGSTSGTGGSGTVTSTATTGGTGTGTGTGTGGAGGDATTSSTSTGSTEMPDCPSYCAAVDANCKGAMAQYPSTASCLASCAALPLGKLSDVDGNSLGCRLYHVGAPAISNAAVHCPHAGPTGGDKDVTDVAAATCGEGCDAFCMVATTVCTGANQQYTDKAACLTDCKMFKADVASYSTANFDKNDFGCRFYHLSVAATDAAWATVHCGHIKSASPTCTK